MNLETAIRDFCRNDGHLPREALGWCNDNWDAAAGAALTAFETIKGEADPFDEKNNLAFHGLYLAAQKRDNRWAAPLARLARNELVLEELLGDGVTEHLPMLVVATYDGDPVTLRAVIEDAAADEYVRCGYMEAHAILALNGVIDAEEAKGWHFDLFERMEPRESEFTWVIWSETAVVFDAMRALPLVKKAFDDELISENIDTYSAFADRAREAAQSPQMTIQKFLDKHKPIDDAAEFLSGWYCYSQAYRDELAKEKAGLDTNRFVDDFADASLPATNPWRDVGRNDACPCGSGKKFKKCCIGTAP